MVKKSQKKPPDKSAEKLWFPTLLQSATNIKSNSWFNILRKENENLTKVDEKENNTTYIKSMKFPIYPDQKQAKILDDWFGAVIDMYNIANKHISEYYAIRGKIQTYYDVRNKLYDKAQEIINKTHIPKHTLDYSIKHCVEMYKSAISNLKNRHIKHFTIKNLSKDKNRYNLVIEKSSFSKKINGFYVKQLGEMKSQRSLIKFFESNAILQYNKNSDTYYIIATFKKDCKYTAERETHCGIDLGVRTMATTYSPNKTIEIGTNLVPIIDKYNKRMDKLRSDKDNDLITDRKYKRVLSKYGNNMRNRIDDLHKKVSKYLVTTYENIHLGKISTQSIISNKTSNLDRRNKRRLIVLSFYKFGEIIKTMGKKYNANIKDINEYMTSKTCHNCQNINKELKKSKTYWCDICGVTLDRDVNAAINIYKKGF